MYSTLLIKALSFYLYCLLETGEINLPGSYEKNIGFIYYVLNVE